MSQIETLLTVKVTPRASKSALSGWEDGVLKVRLKAVPEKGSANRELIAYLSTLLKIPKGEIFIVHGQKGRRKHVKIVGISQEELFQKIEEAMM